MPVFCDDCPIEVTAARAHEGAVKTFMHARARASSHIGCSTRVATNAPLLSQHATTCSDGVHVCSLHCTLRSGGASSRLYVYALSNHVLHSCSDPFECCGRRGGEPGRCSRCKRTVFLRFRPTTSTERHLSSKLSAHAPLVQCAASSPRCVLQMNRRPPHKRC